MKKIFYSQKAMQELYKELIELVRESQLKLGDTSTDIRFFYPLESLNRMMDASLSAEEMENELSGLADLCRGTLGDVSCVRKDDRFCFIIPADGAKWVSENGGDGDFLKEFITEVQKSGSNINTLLPVFKKYSENTVCERLSNGEFDYLVYFADGKPDNYRYCIREDLGHATYHRFNKKDYDAFGF